MQFHQPAPASAESLQRVVHDAILAVGGYWRPLSAVARLLEELGEFVEELSAARPDAGRAGLELADLYVITTCLANQYCVPLAGDYGTIGLAESLDFAEKHSPAPAITDVIVAAGRIARLVNYYDGDKPPKQSEAVPQIGPLVANFHHALVALAASLGVSLRSAVVEVTSRSTKRDIARFARRYDPSTSPSLDGFRAVQQHTQCIFAPIARVWGHPAWAVGSPLEDNLAAGLGAFERFVKVAGHEWLDGYVIELAEEQYGATLPALARSVKRVLQFLSDHDPAGERCMDKQIESTEWQFSFGGLRCFVLAFAPCYGPNSSRYSFGSKSTFIFLQPDISFVHLKIPRGEEKKVRDTIRQAYAAHGRPYDMAIIEVPLEAPRYVKPLRVGDPVVRWWEEQL